MKIIEYELVNAQASKGHIKMLLNQGWQPFGSPVVSEKGIIFQAFVMYEGCDHDLVYMQGRSDNPVFTRCGKGDLDHD